MGCESVPFKVEKVDNPESAQEFFVKKTRIDLEPPKPSSVAEPRPRNVYEEQLRGSSNVEEIDAIPLPEPGKIYEGVLARIFKGTLGDFLGEYVDEDRADIPAYKLVIDIPKLGLRKSIIITHCFSSKCALGRIVECYSDEIKKLGGLRKGMKLLVRYREDSKIEIVCPGEVEGQ